MWHKISFNLIPSISKSEKNWAIEEIKKKTSVSPLFTDIFHFIIIFKGMDFFLKSCQSLNFCRILKRKASNCSEEQSPYIQIPKQFGIHHIGGGEGCEPSPSTDRSTIFLGVSWKVQGLPPPNVVDTKSF